jgi:hypothetical protein
MGEPYLSGNDSDDSLGRRHRELPAVQRRTGDFADFYGIERRTLIDCARGGVEYFGIEAGELPLGKRDGAVSGQRPDQRTRAQSSAFEVHLQAETSCHGRLALTRQQCRRVGAGQANASTGRQPVIILMEDHLRCDLAIGHAAFDIGKGDLRPAEPRHAAYVAKNKRGRNIGPCRLELDATFDAIQQALSERFGGPRTAVSLHRHADRGRYGCRHLDGVGFDLPGNTRRLRENDIETAAQAGPGKAAGEILKRQRMARERKLAG